MCTSQSRNKRNKKKKCITKSPEVNNPTVTDTKDIKEEEILEKELKSMILTVIN
jgi:hypothetical protein